VRSATEHAEAIVAARLIAIVRTDDPDEAVRAIEGLAAAGVQVAEISLSGKDAIEAIERSAEIAGPRLLLGAGTVRSLGEAERATSAGARFLVSPGLDPELLGWAWERDVLHIPGVFTPTELGQALADEALLVKLFPAARLGADYVRDLLAPFPEARLVPTGGITPANILAFLEAGAVAVAAGGALVNRATLSDLDALGGAVRQFHSIIRT
jgi:2-dehydro-3-deoxyphosphogluconate aldolase/(4S)-4-hydroxy-2-oxoglutarate aldolase